MKRLVHPDWNRELLFQEGYILGLVLENPTLFRRTLADMTAQMEGANGEMVLSEDFTPVDMGKYLEVLTTIVPFDIHKKSLFTKITASVEKLALGDTFYHRTQEMLALIERYGESLLEEYPYSMAVTPPTATSLVKMLGIVPEREYAHDMEKLLEYMELVREFDRDKLFVFVNLRGYYTQEDLEAFAADIIRKKLTVLLLDTHEYPRLSCEKRLVIDNDLCELGD